MQIECFNPVENADAKILILGSMPGAESLRQQKYYAFAHNKFWSIMAELLDFDSGLEYPARCEILTRRHIALWDVLKNCHRQGSLDSAIRNEMPNDFAGFLKEHKNIRAIFFNGQKAFAAFKKHVANPQPALLEGINLHSMPSTSPAYAAMKFEKKLKSWSKILDYI